MDRIVLVTGASRGIGRAIALAFAREGANLTITYRSQSEKAEDVVTQIKAMGRRAIAVKANVSDRYEVDKMVERAIAEYSKIEILINNAGVIRRADFLSLSEEDWSIPIAINLNGTFYCTQAVAKHMIEREYGKIVNIASNSGIGTNAPKLASYAVSKGAIQNLTRESAAALGRYNINVNCISPGLVVTELTYVGRTNEEAERFIEERKQTSMLGRVGTTQDIANIALFLASEESSFITGQVIVADGGGTHYLTHSV